VAVILDAPLASRPDPAALNRWLRRWTNVRHREAAERTLLTAIAAGSSPAVLTDTLLAAETERAFADTGHSLDFINKAFECLDLIGWEHAATLLPTVVGQIPDFLCHSRRQECAARHATRLSTGRMGLGGHSTGP